MKDLAEVKASLCSGTQYFLCVLCEGEYFSFAWWVLRNTLLKWWLVVCGCRKIKKKGRTVFKIKVWGDGGGFFCDMYVGPEKREERERERKRPTKRGTNIFKDKRVKPPRRSKRLALWFFLKLCDFTLRRLIIEVTIWFSKPRTCRFESPCVWQGGGGGGIHGSQSTMGARFVLFDCT